MSAPHPNTILFARGALARLVLWPTLRLAVHAAWGGPASAEKQRWLAGVLVDQFEPFLVPTPLLSPASRPAPASTASVPPDAAYIEDLLLQIMSDEFDVDLEDGSAALVARDLVRLFGDVRIGNDAFVRELEVQAERVKGTVPKYEMDIGSGSESSGSESEWEDDPEEEESVPELLPREQPQVDEDGFTVVKKKGRR